MIPHDEWAINKPSHIFKRKMMISHLLEQ